MRKSSIVRLLIAVLLLGGVWVAYTFQGPPASKLDTKKIADDLYVIHNEVVPGNTTVLVTTDGVVLVDDKFPADVDNIVAEVKKITNQPIKYVVNTHHHFDHAGGLGAFAAEGATIITHNSNKAFLEQSLAAPRTIQPDKLTQTGKKAMVEGMQDKRVLSDATHIVELYRIQGTTHADGLIMAYLPKEKLLVEVDVYTPAPPNAAPPAQPNPASVNLYDNIERLKLVVDQILPLHGRKVPLAELQKWIGKAS